jgi:hypothetical protein
MFTLPLMALCALALMSGIFLMSEGFKGEPVDVGRGLRGLGLIVLAVACFPSRRHILYRLWQKRRSGTPPVHSPGATVRSPVATARSPLATARPQVVAASPARARPESPIHEGRVRLDCVLPPEDPARVTSWIGGLPKLPRTVDWPATQDGPMLFVAQIALADLPQGIWGGLGPRTGSLAFFVHADDDFGKVAVLAVDGRLEERAYPAPLEVIQSYPHLKRGFGGELLAAPPGDDLLPLMKWGVRATPIDAEDDLPHASSKYRAADTVAHGHRKAASLSDPALVPYDWPTLIELVSHLIGAMNRLVRRENTPADLFEALQQTAAERKAAAGLLMEMRAELRKRSKREAFTPQHWSATRDRLDGILVRVPKRVQDATTGATRVVIAGPVPVLNCLPMQSYYSALEYLSRGLYARGPGQLPDVVRASFEPVWRFDASHEVASMGGRINLAAHVTAPRDDLVCLLEVPCSELVGTVWHDLSSFGFFIDPESLADGQLDRATGSLAE